MIHIVTCIPVTKTTVLISPLMSWFRNPIRVNTEYSDAAETLVNVWNEIQRWEFNEFHTSRAERENVYWRVWKRASLYKVIVTECVRKTIHTQADDDDDDVALTNNFDHRKHARLKAVGSHLNRNFLSDSEFQVPDSTHISGVSSIRWRLHTHIECFLNLEKQFLVLFKSNSKMHFLR